MSDRFPAKPPYYAVIFSSTMTDDPQGYARMAERMDQLARQQDGFLGVESAREEIGITVSYWRDEASIARWKQQADHQMAQQLGQDRWYASYTVRVARVERQYQQPEGRPIVGRRCSD